VDYCYIPSYSPFDIWNKRIFWRFWYNGHFAAKYFFIWFWINWFLPIQKKEKGLY